MNVAVVGAGVMGLATARALAQRGHDVTVYEQFELKHKRGSSHGTSRIFRLSYDEEYWIRLAQRAYELWRELERESGRTLLELDGLVDVQRVPKRRVEALRGAGVPVEELTPAEALERFGFAYDDVESLVFTRDAGIALADATIDALADGARAAGAEILEHTRVESLDDVPGDRVVVTAGGWAPKLLGRPADELDAHADARDDRLLPRRAHPVADRRARRAVLRADGAGRGREGRLAQGRPADRSRRGRRRAGRAHRRGRVASGSSGACRASIPSRSAPRRASTRTSRTSASSASAAAATSSARRAAATASSSPRVASSSPIRESPGDPAGPGAEAVASAPCEARRRA